MINVSELYYILKTKPKVSQEMVILNHLKDKPEIKKDIIDEQEKTNEKEKTNKKEKTNEK